MRFSAPTKRVSSKDGIVSGRGGRVAPPRKQIIHMALRRLIVVGTLASNPYAGMAWMHMQIAAGLRRLGHDAYYFETTSAWPYDPERETAVNDSRYALP